MFENIKGLIFDLDGTIADTIPAITEAINLTMNELGLPEHTEAEVYTYVNFGPRHLINEALPQSVKESDPKALDRALELYTQKYATTFRNTNVCYDGVRDTIVKLSKKYPIAILSNKQDDFVKILAEQLLPEGVCLAAYGSLDGLPAKPEPTRALELARLLSIPPESCVLIGDSKVDLITANAAGFSSIAVSWGFTSREKLVEAGAVTIIDRPEELLDIFG